METLSESNAATEAHAVIQDFFVFRDVLFVRGVALTRHGKRPAIFLQFWDGSVMGVQAADDCLNPSTSEFWAFSFSFPLARDVPIESVDHTSILFDYDEAQFCLVRPAARGHTRDKFLSSEAGFWSAVHAQPTARVLEIGSRARSGISRRGLFPTTADYTGFDIRRGENVTVVGDAHALSRYLPEDYFDFAFSVSVWEHLAMPWLVSLELNRVLKTGGLAMINTHQSWPTHEEPWDYFRFSDYAWDALFNPATGFEIVDRGMGQRCVMAPSLLRVPSPGERLEWHYGYLATRVVVRKIGPTSLSWPVDPASIANGSYPH